MAKFQIHYTTNRQDLDRVIEADNYKVDTKFFTFYANKEVVRSLRTDIVLEVKRLDHEV